MADRPDAPLIPATAELLMGWDGPVSVAWPDGTVEETAHWDGAVWSPSMGIWTTLDDPSDTYPPDAILLDLRRPEVQDRVSRVWWGRPGAEFRQEHPGWYPARVHVNGEAVAMADRDSADTFECLHVPALATLPTTDTLAWALWECWRAMQGVDRG